MAPPLIRTTLLQVGHIDSLCFLTRLRRSRTSFNSRLPMCQAKLHVGMASRTQVSRLWVPFKTGILLHAATGSCKGYHSSGNTHTLV